MVRTGLVVIPVSSDDSGKDWLGGDSSSELRTGLVVIPVPR